MLNSKILSLHYLQSLRPRCDLLRHNFQIFFYAMPFQEMEQEQIPRLVADGKRPTLYDRVGNVLQNCWTNPSERLIMERIVQTFTTISVSSLLITLNEVCIGISEGSTSIR